MKYTLRVPTKEAYAYIEATYEGNVEDAVERYQELTKAVQGGFGLEKLEWNRVLDDYLESGTMKEEEYHGMDDRQQWMIQEIKKSKKRK